eukprot:COSAG01_NODE_7718_length_3085_cov_2.157066_2_plen_177_part_00
MRPAQLPAAPAACWPGWTGKPAPALTWPRCCCCCCCSGSSSSDASSFSDRITHICASEAAGNSDQQLIGKVRASMRDIERVLAAESAGGRVPQPDEAVPPHIIAPDRLRQILETFDIMFADQQWTALLRSIDADGDGTVSYRLRDTVHPHKLSSRPGLTENVCLCFAMAMLIVNLM